MNKEEVKKYFDQLAPEWDAQLIRSDEKINLILDNAGLIKGQCEGKKVLDVACGTGVLINDYKLRGIKDITAIDISDEMIKIAKEKFPDVNFICADVENTDFETKFDAIVVYNAFPHFPNGSALIEKLSSLINDGGTLTIAHGMSRKQIDNHHQGSAKNVSNGLISAKTLAKIFKYFKLDVVVEIENDSMYQVVGRR